MPSEQSTNVGHVPMDPAVLTRPAAIDAVTRETDEFWGLGAGESRRDVSFVVAQFLRYHGTENRERLRGWLVDVWALGETQADELIDALFGRRD